MGKVFCRSVSGRGEKRKGLAYRKLVSDENGLGGKYSQVERKYKEAGCNKYMCPYTEPIGNRGSLLHDEEVQPLRGKEWEGSSQFFRRGG